MWVTNIASCEDALHRGLRGARLNYDVALLVELHLALNQLCVRVVTNSEEEARNLDIVLLAVALAKACACHTIHIAQNLHGVVLEQNLDVRSVENSLLHSLRCTKEWLAHNEIYLTAERCKVCSLLASGVATTYNCHILLAVEEAVASGTSAHTHTPKLHLRLQTEVLCRSTCADDNRLSLNLFLAIDCEHERSLRGVDIGNNTRANICAQTQSLRTQIVHHLCATNALRITWEVLDFCCCSQLSARLNSLIQYRVQSCTSSVNCSSKSRRTATNDKYFNSLHNAFIFCLLSLYFLFCKSFRLTLFPPHFGSQIPHIGLLCCGFGSSLGEKIA